MKKKSLLWAIDKENLPKSFLFGTMHVKDPRAFVVTDSAVHCLERVDRFYAEINLDEAGAEIPPDAYNMPSGTTIKDLLGTRKYLKTKHILDKAYNIDLDTIDRRYPLMLVNVMMEKILSARYPLPLDMYLWKLAAGRHLHCDGLETVGEQLTLLKTMDLDTQRKMLIEAVRNVKKLRKDSLKAIESYEAQDIHHLYRMTRKSLGKLRHTLLYDRNIVMAKRICMHLDYASFFAVGAAHLSGEKGILHLLKRQGIKLRPL